MGKRVLVTGGAGFLGSYLCEKLISEGCEVICLDNLFTGSKENINHLLDYSSFKFVYQDVMNPINLECEEIYNLACPASPKWYQKDPIYTSKTSFIGALNVLELARITGARVLQASTSEVYGNPLVHPQNEKYLGNVNSIGIRSCYDEGKRIAETLFFDFHRIHNIQIKVMRIFNTYGPRMSVGDGRVISNFIVQALNGENITIYGDGSQTRSFCYVSDLIDGMYKLMNYTGDFTGPLNIGNPEEYSINQLAEMVIRLTESSSQIVYREIPKDDPLMRKPDIRLAGKILSGWQPKIKLEDGLKQTIDFFKNAMKYEM